VPRANRATDSHTHKGVVSLVMLIAHAVARRILAALVSPGWTTMAQFGLESKGNDGSRQDDAPLPRATAVGYRSQVAGHGMGIASLLAI
jgi:hypothetical protein